MGPNRTDADGFYESCVVIVSRLPKLLLYTLAVFGPLSPAMGLFILVAPPLILLSWPTPVQAVLILVDVVMVLVAAMMLGPAAVEEVREAFREERPR
jgi:hypothetical protein